MYVVRMYMLYECGPDFWFCTTTCKCKKRWALVYFGTARKLEKSLVDEKISLSVWVDASGPYYSTRVLC